MLSNLDEYDDPVIYDSENPLTKVADAMQFYLTLCQRVGGPVLELGCGTGRFTIPLAQAGIDITGLDVVPGMVQRAREKSADLSMRWVEADARSFELDQRFALIFESGAMFQHLLDRADQEACLGQVRAHLAPGGLFTMSVTFPSAGMMQNVAHHDWFEHTDAQGRQVRVSGDIQYDPIEQTYHENATRRWLDANGAETFRYAPLTLRLFFPQELEALLHYNGFEVIERYGNWDRSPLQADSPTIIVACRAVPSA